MQLILNENIPNSSQQTHEKMIDKQDIAVQCYPVFLKCNDENVLGGSEIISEYTH